eukprot:6889246-Prymnesium_polylepis.1
MGVCLDWRPPGRSRGMGVCSERCAAAPGVWGYAPSAVALPIIPYSSTPREPKSCAFPSPLSVPLRPR